MLRRNGQEVELTAQTFDILVLLLERSPGLVTKEELKASVWPGRTVTENSLTTAISTLRKALGTGRWIGTIPQRGYQFVGDFQALADDPPAPSPGEVAAPPPAEVSTKRFGRRLALAATGIAIAGLAIYSGWRWIERPVAHSQESLVGKYIRTVPFTSEGFAANEAYVADAITHSIRWRLQYETRDWSTERLDPWNQTIRSGHVRKADGAITVEVKLLDAFRRPIWSDRYSEVYPGGEPLIGEVIAEHFIRLLEQGRRRTEPSRQVFDAVRDFSLNASPQSVWRYGQARDSSGIGFRHLLRTLPRACNQQGEDCWIGDPTPEQGIIGRSRTTGPNRFDTSIQPPDALWMTTGARFTVLRWVAPADGRYAVQGRIAVADTVGRPCRVKLVHNTLDVLMERRNFGGYGSTIPVDIPDLPLTQGSAIDLIFGPELAVDYLSLNVKLTIRPVAKL